MIPIDQSRLCMRGWLVRKPANQLSEFITFCIPEHANQANIQWEFDGLLKERDERRARPPCEALPRPRFGRLKHSRARFVNFLIRFRTVRVVEKSAICDGRARGIVISSQGCRAQLSHVPFVARRFPSGSDRSRCQTDSKRGCIGLHAAWSVSDDCSG